MPPKRGSGNPRNLLQSIRWRVVRPICARFVTAREAGRLTEGSEGVHVSRTRQIVRALAEQAEMVGREAPAVEGEADQVRERWQEVVRLAFQAGRRLPEGGGGSARRCSRLTIPSSAVPGILTIRSQDTNYGERNFSFRFDDLVAGLPAVLTDRQLDWMEILGHLFAVDVACERGPGDVAWSREVQAWLPVRDPEYWSSKRSAIKGIWTDLTDDGLDITFEQAADPATPPRQSQDPFPAHDGVALVSGGQDSFAGALNVLEAGRTPLLLSHTASGATNSAQNSVETVLKRRESNLVRVKLSARKAADRYFPGMESSQRSRTFLFVGAAAVIAAVGGSGQVWLNENGIMALHVPLTAARVGSLSTHTAEYLQSLSACGTWRVTCWRQTSRVDNELVHLTKPGVVERAVSLGHRDDLRDTTCWQIGRTRTHCGFCAPCLMRRIASECHGVPDVTYQHDLFDDPSSLDDPRARDNLVHFVSLVQDLQDLLDLELEFEYPELLNGAPALTLADAIQLHRSWGDEAADILFSHPVPNGLR